MRQTEMSIISLNFRRITSFDVEGLNKNLIFLRPDKDANSEWSISVFSKPQEPTVPAQGCLHLKA